MRIIPVIDLMGGVAVRAVAGRRADYRPLETPLAQSSDPRDVAEGFLRLHPFKTIYLADLDAILGRSGNERALARLAESFPETEFWLDRGLREPPAAANFVRVVGSESLALDLPPPNLSQDEHAVLSLDFDGARFLGPSEVEQGPAIWPKRVIAMTLAKIGGGRGPDFDRLSTIKARAGNREIYAAGGVRGAEDLAAVASLEITGALVATALHAGRIGPQELVGYA